MKRIFCLFFLLSLFASLNQVVAQTYCYKYQYSVKDEVKIPGIPAKGTIFYFTFTENKNKCFLTDKNEVYSSGYGQNTYQYIGRKNGINIYKECNRNMFRNGQDMLYFSSDYGRLNWRCCFDDYSPNTNNQGCIRVLDYVKDPNTSDMPSQLY
jgi:hypothetical protein